MGFFIRKTTTGDKFRVTAVSGESILPNGGGRCLLLKGDPAREVHRSFAGEKRSSCGEGDSILSYMRREGKTLKN